MKTLAQIELDLEREGFHIKSGKYWGGGYSVLNFFRDEEDGCYSIINVRHFDKQPDEENEEEDEEEFEFRSQDEKLFALYQLSSKYPDEVVDLIIQGKMKVPGWLKKEILERRE